MFLPSHFRVLLFLRFLYSLTTQTYGVPDEFWQGPEVSHRLVFGPGHRTWEWDPGTALRSYTYPVLLSILYWPLVGVEWCMHLIPLPTALRVWVAQRVFLPLLWYAPRAFATVCTLGVDAALYTLTEQAFGGRAAWWATTLYATSWFSIHASARPLSNGAEAALTLWALVLWWWGSGGGRLGGRRGTNTDTTSDATTAIGLAGGLVGLSFLIRPTSALVWAVVAGGVVWGGNVGALVGVVITRALPCFLAVLLGLTVGLDWVLYGKCTFPPWSFLAINSLQGWSALFGTHPWHWYFLTAIPASLTVTLPLLLHGLWGVAQQQQWRKRGASLPSNIADVALGTALLHSLSHHKEDRYLSAVLPLLYVFIGASAASLSDAKGVPQWAKALAFALFLATNLPTGLYLNMHHQRGAVAAVEALARHAAMATYYSNSNSSSSGTGDIHPGDFLLSAHFIMPCHSTPFHSLVHYPRVELRQLDCSPTSRLLKEDGPFHGGHVCRYTGCCGGVEGRAPFTESSALEFSGGGLLRAVYGSDPALYTPPRICTQGGGTSSSSSRGPSSTSSPFLTHPLGFAQEFAPKGCASGVGGGGDTPPPYHPLPTHLLLFDSDARRPEVIQWLSAANYSWGTMQAFSHSPLFQGDSHSHHQPKEVLLFTHPCWTAAWEHAL